jgi:hypothetical protein
MTKPNTPTRPKDPHPSDEEHADRQRHPGGAHPPTRDLGTNPAIHDGHAPPMPDYRRKRNPSN